MALSMMEACILEVLKAHPYTYEEVKERFDKNNLQDFTKDYDFDFEPLLALYKANPQQFEQAYTRNYQVKFMTMGGLRNILRMRFSITDDQYRNGGSGTVLTIDKATGEIIQYRDIRNTLEGQEDDSTTKGELTRQQALDKACNPFSE